MNLPDGLPVIGETMGERIAALNLPRQKKREMLRSWKQAKKAEDKFYRSRKAQKLGIKRPTSEEVAEGQAEPLEPINSLICQNERPDGRICGVRLGLHQKPDYICPDAVIDDLDGPLALFGLNGPKASLENRNSFGGSDQADPAESTLTSDGVAEADSPVEGDAVRYDGEQAVSIIPTVLLEGEVADRSESDGADQGAVFESDSLDAGILPNHAGQPDGLAPNGDHVRILTPIIWRNGRNPTGTYGYEDKLKPTGRRDGPLPGHGKRRRPRRSKRTTIGVDVRSATG